ncbi:hypothetical protein [Colwellia sp. 12G3]|uniref:hypothetical protein n=1 Tax=Colwellia sp. 12G3 TaxID=2058299 RepID=UPI000C3388A3|nr:hypothetical protein [Colwellia sp. 12G3]PKI17384.1 hypothetical protein CXF71_04390 [Colwellia sp. 12G3]
MIRPIIITETPFDKRHCCWFCGEPSHAVFIFPSYSSAFSYESDKYLSLSSSHPVISVPACRECQKLANKAEESTILAVRANVKKQLIQRYAKDLAIGVNWTEQELATSEFEQGNFAGFARSAWFMYEVAKTRVSYLAWPLVANGIELEEIDLEEIQAETFSFDGVLYPSLSDAINHYAKIFLLDEHYVIAVLQHLGNGDIDEKSFAQAVRFCRLLVNASPSERKVAFNNLVAKNQR